MNKKNGFNLMFFAFIIILIVNFSCANEPKSEESGILMRTDSDFSALSQKEGMFKAFLTYIAEDGVILRDNSYPSEGKEALRAYYEGKSDTSFILAWEPSFGSISESGDLGYTYGVWTNTNKASGIVSHGMYLTIWKKQADGTWRFVLDTGTQGLPEVK